ncbi:MAG: hypothetical protein IPH35_13490 [Rhodoferax sp.]|nr:hypothetical protein [Rhodoferax sp.]
MEFIRRLIEIDENLCRAELTASQRTKYTKRRAQIWDALHPVKIQVSQDDRPELKPVGYKSPPPQTTGFAAATAASTGQSAPTTYRLLARAKALGDTTLDKITSTSLDTGVEMDALAKLPEPARAELIERKTNPSPHQPPNLRQQKTRGARSAPDFRRWRLSSHPSLAGSTLARTQTSSPFRERPDVKPNAKPLQRAF